MMRLQPLRHPTRPRTLQAFALFVSVLVSIGGFQVLMAQDTFRPPSVPLVACDPYFSLWSPSDHLASASTTHWTGRNQELNSAVKIDGTTWRLMGAESKTVQAMRQSQVTVLPTRTIYTFQNDQVAITLTFMTPSLPESIDLLSWPVTYMTYNAKTIDGKSHQVTIDFEASSNVSIDDSTQPIEWSTPKIDGLSTHAVGSKSQNILGRSGDDLRIDWGYFYVSASESQKPTWNGHRLSIDMGSVANDGATKWLMLAYDDLYSIQYMQQDLRPYWRRNGREASDLLKEAAAAYPDLLRRCTAFDEELMTDLRKAGNENYANLCALCYRQCFAAGKFVADANGQPLQFSKENHSNGCIATSDVFYPMAPQFLLFGPSLAKSFLVPFLDYAASDRWRFPFAPHDLGTYPLANGQVYGGGERTEENQMPVEESGNVILLVAAIAQMENSPEFANRYWTQIEKWANYLSQKGFDPDNQLCTDDFAGHLAHNVNLSAKAICALGAYAKLCDMRGETQKSIDAFALARGFAKRWMESAEEGDHYRLAFDQKGSWSQKYNLVWDRILGLNLFPDSVAKKEMSYYRRIQNEFGLALDNRETYTKLDWILWSATLTQDREDFDALIQPVIAFINKTPDRSPLTDWYQTKSARKVGFTARPVVGGVFLQILYDKKIWGKWASRDTTKASNWAAMPKLPVVKEMIATAQTSPATWYYTTDQPSPSWNHQDFDASIWKTGQSGFGTKETPSAVVGTNWSSADIWMIRDIELPEADLSSTRWTIHHDEDTEIYINGELAETLSGYTSQYATKPLSKESKRLLKTGRNRIAIHCHQTGGGQYIDVGLATIEKR
jgi:hypothetical protein